MNQLLEMKFVENQEARRLQFAEGMLSYTLPIVDDSICLSLSDVILQWIALELSVSPCPTRTAVMASCSPTNVGRNVMADSKWSRTAYLLLKVESALLLKVRNVQSFSSALPTLIRIAVMESSSPINVGRNVRVNSKWTPNALTVSVST